MGWSCEVEWHGPATHACPECPHACPQELSLGIPVEHPYACTLDLLLDPLAFQPLYDRLTALKLNSPASHMPGVAAAIAAHLSGSLQRLRIKVS